MTTTNAWIDINLPWDSFDAKYPEYKEYPDLTDQFRTLFGETVEEAEVRLQVEDRWNAFRKLEDQVDMELALEGVLLKSDEKKVEVRRRLLLTEDEDVKAVFEYRDFYQKHNQWLEEQPEIIEIATANRAIEKEFYSKQETEGTSFCSRNLNVPGTLIEVKRADDKVHQLLIGDLNKIGGVCDDCSGIEREDIVLRYKIVWEKE